MLKPRFLISVREMLVVLGGMCSILRLLFFGASASLASTLVYIDYFLAFRGTLAAFSFVFIIGYFFARLPLLDYE